MKKLLSMIIAISLAATLAGCNNKQSEKSEQTGNTSAQQEAVKDEKTGDSNINEPGTFPIVKNPVKMSAFVIHNDIEANAATIELRKKTNIDFEFVVVTGQSANEKKQLLLASGDYPEVFLSGGFSNEDIMMYGPQQKVFIPMNSLIDRYAPEVKKTDSEIQGFLKGITAPDGNIYGLPSINVCYHGTFGRKLWMNTKWLEKLGLKMPETTDEFYTVLKAFKEKDPNGNNKKDEIPLSGALNTWAAEPQHYLMNSFIYDDGNYYFRVLNGKLDFVANKPEWKEGLKYINKLYKEGLIDPAAFTQGLEQLIKIGDNPGVPIVGAATCGHVAMCVSMDNTPEHARHKDYNPVAPLKGPAGVRIAPGGPYTPSGAHFVITDKCKNPEVAMRLADFIYSEEGSLLLEAGPEGKGWQKAKDGEKDILGRQAKYSLVNAYKEINDANIHWNQATATKRLSEFDGYRGFWTTAQDAYTAEGYEKRLFDATKDFYEPYKSEQRLDGTAFLSQEDIEQAGQLKTNVTEYVKQSMVRFITEDLDIEKDWESYVKQLDNLQIEKYREIYAKAYKLN